MITEAAFTHQQESLYYSYTCLRCIRCCRLLLVLTGIFSFAVLVFSHVLIYVVFKETPIDVLFNDRMPGIVYIYILVIGGSLVLGSKFPQAPDSNTTVTVYTVPFFIIALFTCFDGHIDHMIFCSVAFFHTFCPLKKKYRDLALVFLFGVTSVVYWNKNVNNVYAESCLNSILPPQANIFLQNLTVADILDIIGDSPITSGFDISSLVNPSISDGSEKIVSVSNWDCHVTIWRLVVILTYMIIIFLINMTTSKHERKSFATMLSVHRARLNVKNQHAMERNRSSKLRKTVTELEGHLKRSKHNERELQLMKNALEELSSEKTNELRGVLVDSKLVEIEGMIGKGGFGEVHLGTYNNQKVAIKQLIDLSKNNIERFRFECFLMKNLRHPNIVRLVGVCWDEYVFACLLEYVPNGTLEDQFKSDYELPREEKLTWKGTLLRVALETALGMQYLHNSRYHDEKTDVWKDCIIHRDLKPANMLIADDWSTKLSDFGEARAMDTDVWMTQVGTREFFIFLFLSGHLLIFLVSNTSPTTLPPPFSLSYSYLRRS